MSQFRITDHPVLRETDQRQEIEFFFENRPLKAQKGEMISAALFANGIRIFGKHHRDGAPQGIFCANGQCAQCLVLADGHAVKSCIAPITPGMHVEPLNGLPKLPADDKIENTSGKPREIDVPVFIMGGGPAGLAAAIELAKENVKVIVADDKHELGGKLTLQTHNFFGSAQDCYAGVRGLDIGKILSDEVAKCPSVEIWLNSPVVGVFADKKIGVVKDGKYVLVNPERFLCAAGAREKAIAFPGCDLPGVYGAGAFQTLVNRDMVKCSERLFVVGGGNVGLIAAYHALQAGIDVLGLVEALPTCGGYKVHLDKIKRLGIPVWNCHTVVRAEGNGKLERVTIAEVDKNFKPIPGTEAEFEVDTLLIAAGLAPVNEMYKKAQEFGMTTYAAGDADIIAEASAAIFGGKITGRKILQDMGYEVETPEEWNDLAQILRSKPQNTYRLEEPNPGDNQVYPVIRCLQEIPCNPCVEECNKKSLYLHGKDIMGVPKFDGECGGCTKCVAVCPGLAITLVDEEYDETKQKALVIMPWELPDKFIKVGDEVTTTGMEGEVIGRGKIIKMVDKKWQDKRKLMHLEVPFAEAKRVASVRVREPAKKMAPLSLRAVDDDEIIICRCERVTKKTIAAKIKDGCQDFNALKSELRIGMGPCGGKTCLDLIWRIYQEQGVDRRVVEPHVYRPFEMEVPLSAFLNDPQGGVK